VSGNKTPEQTVINDDKKYCDFVTNSEQIGTDLASSNEGNENNVVPSDISTLEKSKEIEENIQCNNDNITAIHTSTQTANGTPNNSSEVIKTVISSDGTPTEVKMRAPVRRYSQKTASFRWSGSEMLQINGPQAVVNNSPENVEILAKEDQEARLKATRINIGYKKTNAKLERKLKHMGFERSSTFDELPKDGDNCFKALLDQMSQPDQDFKVWEKDDYSFLRWYIVKQLEIHIGAGRADNFIRSSETHRNTEEFLNHLQKDESYVDNDYLFSVSKIFNKDIIVIDSCDEEKVTYLKGGQDEKNGKGNPLYLAHLRKEDAGENYYQSIVPSENIDISKLI